MYLRSPTKLFTTSYTINTNIIIKKTKQNNLPIDPKPFLKSIKAENKSHATDSSRDNDPYKN